MGPGRGAELKIGSGIKGWQTMKDKVRTRIFQSLQSGE